MSGPTPAPRLYSIVMPAYNEEASVGSTLRALIDALDKAPYAYEIIVVNDASTDGTAAVLESLAAEHSKIRWIENPGPNGYGAAIRKGLEHYAGDAVVVVTADGSDAPKDVLAYFAAIAEGADCAFGSRFRKGARVRGYPPFKLFVNRLANGLCGLLLASRYDDFTNGFKCYRRVVIDAMDPIVSNQFNITIEMTVKAIQGGWRIVVLPTDWTQRAAGVSNFRLLKLIKPYAATLLYCLTLHYLRRVRR
jgi:dolichol-phosphate mannosyltransferase